MNVKTEILAGLIDANLLWMSYQTSTEVDNSLKYIDNLSRANTQLAFMARWANNAGIVNPERISSIRDSLQDSPFNKVCGDRIPVAISLLGDPSASGLNQAAESLKMCEKMTIASTPGYTELSQQRYFGVVGGGLSMLISVFIIASVWEKRFVKRETPK